MIPATSLAADPVISRRRTVLLSDTGGDRATAYFMSNKIVRREGHLFCTWIDSNRVNQWAMVEQKSGEIVHRGAIGEPRRDNHAGGTLTIDPDGDLHLLTGDHHSPFVHFRLAAGDKPTEWKAVEDGKAIGEMSTYPSLVCDRAGTLHLIYRHRALPHYFVDYCQRRKDGAWTKPRTLLRASVTDHTWMSNALEIGPDGRLHLVVSNTHPLPEAGRYYGASHLYSDDAGETWRQFESDEPLKLPLEVAKLARIEGDKLDPERIEEKVAPWDQGSIFVNSYHHQMVLSCPVIDGKGKVSVIVHNTLQGAADLYQHDGQRWIASPLLPAVEKLLPDFRISYSSQLARHADGTLEAVLMAMPQEAKGWGDPRTELVRLQCNSAGDLQTSELVRSIDPELAHWQPSLERWNWHAPRPAPALLFTRGINAHSLGGNRNLNSLKTEVWLQLPEAG
jgi:hypothetical protein